MVASTAASTAVLKVVPSVATTAERTVDLTAERWAGTKVAWTAPT
jgi:hypothetical protein